MKKFIGVFLGTFLFLLAISAIFNRALFPLVDMAVHPTAPGNLHDRLNMIYNSYYVWRESIVLAYLSRLLSGFLVNPLHAPFITSMALIFSGSVAYLSRKTPNLKVSFFVLSGAVTVSILLILGCDNLIFQSLSFSFWFLFFTSAFFRQKRLIDYNTLGFVISVFLITETGNQYAFVVALFCMAISLFSEKNIHEGQRFCAIVTLCIMLLGTLYSDTPMIPEYPANSHVVPDDNIPGNIMPYIGPFPVIPLINRQGLKYFHFFPVAVLFIGSLVAWSAFRRKEIKSHFLLFLTVCCMLDAFFPEHISVISPLYVFTRIIPGLFYIPLLPYAIAFAIIMFAIVASEYGKHIFPVAAFLFLLSLFGSKFNLNPTLAAAPQDILASPSFFLLKENGPGVLDRKNADFIFRKPALSDFESWKASANQDEHHISNLFDGKEKTRWSPGKGRQDGDEWILFNFKFERTLKGLILNPGVFFPDFPRGIEVEASVDCQNFFSIYQSPKWQGGIDFTSDGFPYYTSQSDVKLFFDNPVDLKCFRIKQVGKTPNFDWSISELELIL